MICRKTVKRLINDLITLTIVLDCQWQSDGKTPYRKYYWEPLRPRPAEDRELYELYVFRGDPVPEHFEKQRPDFVEAYNIAVLAYDPRGEDWCLFEKRDVPNGWVIVGDGRAFLDKKFRIVYDLPDNILRIPGKNPFCLLAGRYDSGDKIEKVMLSDLWDARELLAKMQNAPIITNKQKQIVDNWNELIIYPPDADGFVKYRIGERGKIKSVGRDSLHLTEGEWKMLFLILSRHAPDRARAYSKKSRKTIVSGLRKKLIGYFGPVEDPLPHGGKRTAFKIRSERCVTADFADFD